jgi:hypothetical protein
MASSRANLRQVLAAVIDASLQALQQVATGAVDLYMIGLVEMRLDQSTRSPRAVVVNNTASHSPCRTAHGCSQRPHLQQAYTVAAAFVTGGRYVATWFVQHDVRLFGVADDCRRQ